MEPQTPAPGLLVRHFRQILLWPLQSVPIKAGKQIQRHWKYLERLGCRSRTPAFLGAGRLPAPAADEVPEGGDHEAQSRQDLDDNPVVEAVLAAGRIVNGAIEAHPFDPA